MSRIWAVRLNTLFVRYGCGTLGVFSYGIVVGVLIPYSSGMGVGRFNNARAVIWAYVLIPYSSGMGVGPAATGRPFPGQPS